MSARVWLCTVALALLILPDFLFAPRSRDFFKVRRSVSLSEHRLGAGLMSIHGRLHGTWASTWPETLTFIVENMPGAGHRIAANHVYKVARPDGLTIGNFFGGLLVGQVLGYSGIEFDAVKFEYIGVPVKDNPVCALTKASGITNYERWSAAKAPVKLGATGADDLMLYGIPKILNAALGLPVQVVAGYKGTSDIRLAAESGELAGGCWGWESIRSTWRTAIESGDVNVVLQTVPKSQPELEKVPLAIEMAKTDEGTATDPNRNPQRERYHETLCAAAWHAEGSCSNITQGIYRYFEGSRVSCGGQETKLCRRSDQRRGIGRHHSWIV